MQPGLGDYSAQARRAFAAVFHRFADVFAQLIPNRARLNGRYANAPGARCAPRSSTATQSNHHCQLAMTNAIKTLAKLSGLALLGSQLLPHRNILLPRRRAVLREVQAFLIPMTDSSTHTSSIVVVPATTRGWRKIFIAPSQSQPESSKAHIREMRRRPSLKPLKLQTLY